MTNNPLPPEPFGDPALYQWFFFRRSEAKAVGTRDLSTSQQDDEYLKRFWTVTKQAGDWANVTPAIPNKSPELQLKPRRSSRLISRPWKPRNVGDTREYELDSRSLLDVFWLNIGQVEDGKYAGDALPALVAEKFNIQQIPGDKEFFIGEANCLSAEFDENVLTLSEWRARAKELKEKWMPQETASRISFDCLLEYGYFAYISGVKQETLILLLYKQHIGNVSRLRSLILPNLALSCLKLRHIEREYDEDFSRRATKATTELNEQLKNTLAAGRSLDELEAYTSTLSEKHLQLLPVIEAIESRIQTLRVNAANLEKDLSDSGWGNILPSSLPQQRELDGLIRQMESDLYYVNIAQKKVEVASQQLQTIASVRVAQTERYLTLAFSLFGVMALAQVFPQYPWETNGAESGYDLAWRGLLILVSGFVLFLTAHLFSQRGKNKVKTS